MCSATVQSLNHVRAMTIYKKSKGKDGRESEQPERVVETRLTGFGVHACILASALALPQLSLVPLPVVAGVFLYLGRKVMSGNQFLRRCKQIFLDSKELSVTTDGEKEQVQPATTAHSPQPPPALTTTSSPHHRLQSSPPPPVLTTTSSPHHTPC